MQLRLGTARKSAPDAVKAFSNANALQASVDAPFGTAFVIRVHRQRAGEYGYAD